VLVSVLVLTYQQAQAQRDAATRQTQPDQQQDDETDETDNQERDQENGEPVPPSTADHRKYDILQQEFATAPDVTAACLTCHTEGARQLHATIHWTWAMTPTTTGQVVGKRHIIDNHVLATTENEAYCATCHTGYRAEDGTFAATAANNIDCLSCHDTTGTYAKLPGAGGHPAYEPTEYPPGSGHTWQPPDLNEIAQHVGPTSRTTCGSCHFGERTTDPFIHGHLPAALGDNPSEDLDVHMGTDYLDFSCSTCHTPQQHQFFSSKYQPVSASDMADSHQVHATCISCHDQDDVHANGKLTDHIDRVACQTCHIPQYARAGPVMTTWDWSQAGKSDDQGQPVVERTEDGLLTYHGDYGAFTWDENITPQYTWFDGTITFTTVGDVITPTNTVQVNQYHGSYANPEARLWPLRVYRGVQPYDSEQDTLVAVNLHGDEESAYWQGSDWDAAIESAMQAEGVPYSGNYDFVETEMAWLLNHTVAPAEDAVTCGQCHSRTGILANISGSYVPGRDFNRILDIFGWLLVGGAFVAVLGHGVLRVLAARRRENATPDDATNEEDS
jgi:octaheme c-type cytochrome (tetrathionate reductase family)